MRQDSRWAQLRVAGPTGLAAFLAPLNSTMVALALPDIRREFDVGVLAVSWMVTGYLVAVAIAQPVGGRFGDAFGSLRVLRAGLLGMIAFSALAAFAPSFWLVVAARSVQGVAAAVLIPGATAYLREHVQADRLSSTLGLNASFTSAGAASGPIVGGVLLLAGGWPAIFLFNIPIAAVVLVLLRWLEPDHTVGRRPLDVDPRTLSALALAFSGAALLGTALRLGSYAVLAASLIALGAGIAVYGAVYRKTGRGIVDLRLFEADTFAAAAVMTALSNAVMYTTLVTVPVYAANVGTNGHAVVGLLLFGLSATSIVSSPTGGRLAQRFGHRAMAAVGALVIACASLLILGLVGLELVLLLAVPLAALGIGLGLAGPGQQAAALSAWPVEFAGSAAGTLSLMRYVGSVGGASLLAGVLGSDPTHGDIVLLMAIVSGVAAANASVGFVSWQRGSRHTAIA